MAVKKFLKFETPLLKDKNISTEYYRFMWEYQSMGRMEAVPTSDLSSTSYYLPYHTVPKASRITTKVRVVFDGSAVARSGKSLNYIF